MAALRRIDAAIQNLQRRREEEEPVAGWRSRTVERGSSGQWERKRERGPLASLLAGSFRGEEKRFGEKRRWAASWAVGPDCWAVPFFSV